MADDKKLINFLLDAKKMAEDANPFIKELLEQNPVFYQPIYGYIITFSSN